VTRKLLQNGYVDVAARLYEKTGDESLLAPTATDDRIDQAYVSKPLADAITAYALLTTPPGASDHHGLVVGLDTDLIDTDRLWGYR
jgi:dienelactone hydrolase